MTMDKRISLSKENIEYLRRAFSHFFPEDAIYAADKPFESGEFNWKNRADFIDFVYRLTGISIKSEKDLGAIKKAQFEIENLLGESPSPEKPVEANVPDKEARALQELERQKREADLEKTRVNAEQEIKRSIEKQQKIQEYLKNRKVVVTPTEKLTEVTLTPDEKEKIYNLARAVNTDPGTTQKIIEEKIRESVGKSSEDVKKNVTDPLITKTTLDLIEKIKPFSEYSKPEEIPDNIQTLNPVSPLIAITNSDDPRLKELIPDVEARNSLAQNTKYLSFAVDSERSLNSALTAPLFENSKNISTLFYPQQISEFQIAEDQRNEENREEGAEISLGDVYNQGRDLRDVWQKIANRTVTADEVTTSVISAAPSYALGDVSAAGSATYFTTLALPATVGGVVGLGTNLYLSSYTPIFADWVATSTPLLAEFTTTPTPVFTEWATTSTPWFSFTTSEISSPLSIEPKWMISGKWVEPTPGVTVLTAQEAATEKLANTAVVKGAGAKAGQTTTLALATKKGISGLIAKVGAFLGSVGPVIGTIIGAVVGWVVGKIAEKIPWKKIGPWLLGGLIGGFAYFVAGPIVGIVAGVGAFGLAAASAGGSITLGAVGAGIGGFFKIVGGIIATSFITTPFLIGLLFTPIIVALILFIINSGAYVVPMGSSVTAINFSCKTDQNGDQSLPTSDSPSADAAICIVSYLKQFNLNPLTGSLVGSTSWNNLEKVLAKPALDALNVSATYNNYLQCVGFTSATAGLAYNQAFAQINACSYINHPPAGYSYVSGINGIKSGDFFVIDGVDGCSNTSPGHIGVVVSVDGALISCADANMTGAGQVRATRGCFALAQLSGYLRKQ